MALLLTTAVIVVAFLVAGVAILAAWIVVDVLIYQCALRPGLERDLGFRDGTAILPSEGLRGYISAVAVSAVTEDGPFASAGVRSGDVLPDESHTSLFRKLHRYRGKTVELAIVDAGEGPPFYERPRRIIRIPVPPRAAGPHA
jgi:hypothetical protein